MVLQLYSREYLIIVQQLLNVIQNGLQRQFNLVELIVNIEGINLNVRNVNGMTPFDLAVHNVRRTAILYSCVVLLSLS